MVDIYVFLQMDKVGVFASIPVNTEVLDFVPFMTSYRVVSLDERH
jgi:hypothetical protein